MRFPVLVRVLFSVLACVRRGPIPVLKSSMSRAAGFASLIVSLILCGGAFSPVRAQPSSGPAPVLTLDVFLQQVVRASPAAQSLRLEDNRARAEILEARSGFEPSVASGYEYKTQDDKDKLNVLRSGFALPVNAPLSPSLLVDYRRGLGSSVDPSVVTSPDGELRFGVSFAPLQGLLTNKRQARLQKARLAPDRADAVQAQGRNDLLLEATLAFWAWTEAQRVLDVNQDLLAIATQRRDFVVRQAQAGEAAAIDSVEAELAVASRQGKVASAQRKAEQARAKLAVFLWDDAGAPQTERYAPPVLADVLEAPDALDPAPLDSVRALTTALQRRPALQALTVKDRQLRVEQRLARERLRPDLKLEAQMISYDARPLDVSDVKLGFKIEQPLFFRSGRSEAEQVEVERQSLRFKQDLLQQKVRTDVEAALVAVRQARRQVDAAERQVDLARRLQQAEQRRFDLGESTLFLVNQREKAFAEAREAFVSARVDVLRARATLRWATGTIADGLTLSGL